MIKELYEITDPDTSNIFIKLAFYKTFKDTNELSYMKSKDTLDRIREKVSRGKSQYKAYLMD